MSFPSRPSRLIVPLVGRTSVAKAVRREVFPAPLGPRSAWNPGPSDHDTSSTAQVLPYETVRWETVKCGMRNSRSDDFRHDWRIEDIPYRACLRTRAPACPGPCRHQGVIGPGDECRPGTARPSVDKPQYRQAQCRLMVSAPTPYGDPRHTYLNLSPAQVWLRCPGVCRRHPCRCTAVCTEPSGGPRMGSRRVVTSHIILAREPNSRSHPLRHTES